jgi:hypothetical protein
LFITNNWISVELCYKSGIIKLAPLQGNFMYIIGSSSPEKLAFVILSRKTGIDPASLFKAACDYNEIRITKKRIRDFFIKCFYREVVPVVVEEFCHGVIAHRIRLDPLEEFYGNHRIGLS